MALDPFKIDWCDLRQVKEYADSLADESLMSMTVILRPGHTMFSVIHTENEVRLVKDATVVYRTSERLPT
jgi:mannosyltransferase OCH1-like enzyme